MCRNTHDDCSLLSMCRVEQPKTHAPSLSFEITARTNGGPSPLRVHEEVIFRRPNQRAQRVGARFPLLCCAGRAEDRCWVPTPSWLRRLEGRLQNHGNSVSIGERISRQYSGCRLVQLAPCVARRTRHQCERRPTVVQRAYLCPIRVDSRRVCCHQ